MADRKGCVGKGHGGPEEAFDHERWDESQFVKEHFDFEVDACVAGFIC